VDLSNIVCCFLRIKVFFWLLLEDSVINGLKLLVEFCERKFWKAAWATFFAIEGSFKSNFWCWNSDFLIRFSLVATYFFFPKFNVSLSFIIVCSFLTWLDELLSSSEPSSDDSFSDSQDDDYEEDDSFSSSILWRLILSIFFKGDWPNAPAPSFSSSSSST
jgi:hypothetical protein